MPVAQSLCDRMWPSCLIRSVEVRGEAFLSRGNHALIKWEIPRLCRGYLLAQQVGIYGGGAGRDAGLAH